MHILTVYLPNVADVTACSWRTCPGLGIRIERATHVRCLFLNFQTCPSQRAKFRHRTDIMSVSIGLYRSL
jgi:hypothetical protein